jgi:hypothetical protein
MFTYYTRLLDRFDRPVASLAILGDDEPGWRPAGYDQTLWGCQVAFTFPTVKLVEYRERLAELEAERNPFATVVLAHLTALATRRDATGRQVAKLGLVRRLYALGYGREDVVRLFRLIDWLLGLPAALERPFWQAVQALEEEQGMSYVTSIERIGREEGLRAGRQAGLLAGLAVVLGLRFGDEGRAWAETLRAVTDTTLLEAILERAATVASLAELQALVRDSDA